MSVPIYTKNNILYKYKDNIKIFPPYKVLRVLHTTYILEKQNMSRHLIEDSHSYIEQNFIPILSEVLKKL